MLRDRVHFEIRIVALPSKRIKVAFVFSPQPVSQRSLGLDLVGTKEANNSARPEMILWADCQ